MTERDDLRMASLLAPTSAYSSSKSVGGGSSPPGPGDLAATSAYGASKSASASGSEDIDAIFNAEVAKINTILNESDDTTHGELNMLMNEDAEESLNAVQERVKVRVAVDSGAVANTVHPRELPDTVRVEENRTGKHFSGAGGETIEKFGSCTTLLEGEAGMVGCNWSVADVTRPLHSVSCIAGPEEHPTGLQDVLFNNKKCVVVPPGVVEMILKTVKPVAQYNRERGLYVADMIMSGFPRPGQQQ